MKIINTRDVMIKLNPLLMIIFGILSIISENETKTLFLGIQTGMLIVHFIFVICEIHNLKVKNKIIDHIYNLLNERSDKND